MKKLLGALALLTFAAPALAGGGGGIIGGIIGGVVAAFFTGGLSLLWTAAAIVGGAAVGYAVGATVEMIINPPSFDMPDASNAQAESQNAGVLINKQGTNIAVPVVYGQRKIGAIRVFVATNGETNKYLYMACVLSEGEIEDITKVFIDDTLVWQGNTSHGSTYTTTETNNFKGRFTFQAFHGTSTQGYSSLLNEAPGWGTDKTLKGLSYLACKCEWPKVESNTDAQNNPWTGVPNITVEMRGKRVMYPSNLGYDISGLSYEQRRDFENPFGAYGYSNHPVDCFLDYLRNPIYGKDLSDSQIDWHSFYAARIRWDKGSDGSALPANKLHRTNGIIFTDRSIMDNVKTFLLNMRSALVYQDGRYRLVPVDNGSDTSIYSNSSSSVMTINEDDIIDGIRIQAESAEEKYNRVVVTYMGNKDGSGLMTYEPLEYTYPEPFSALESQYQAADGYRIVETRITLEHITDLTTAAKVAQIILDRARNKGKTVTFQGNARLFQLEVGDIVTLQYSSLAINSKYRVKNIVQNADFTFQLTLEEHEDTVYAYNPTPKVVKGYKSNSLGEGGIVDIVLPTKPSTLIPTGAIIYTISPQYVVQVLNLAGIEILIPQQTILYNAKYVRVYMRKSGDSTFNFVREGVLKVGTTAGTQFCPGLGTIELTTNTNYDILVKAVDYLGNESAGTVTSYTTQGDSSGIVNGATF